MGALRYWMLLPSLLAGLWWTRGHVLPLITFASFSLALLLVGLVGAAIQALLTRSRENPDASAPAGIFQLLWLGQLFILGFGILSTLPLGLLSHLLGLRLSLRFSVPAAALTFLWLLRYREKAHFPWRAPARHSLILAGLLALALGRGLSLHSAHAGALGHDTQQHLYWAQHIVDYGFLPWASRGTDLIEGYPRLFHLLAACWSGIGVFGEVGPFLKVMPLLQTVMACGFAAELVLTRTRQTSSESDLPAIFLGAFLTWHLTRGDGQYIYPIFDLNGLPRCSAAWLLYGPALVVMADRVGTLADVRPLLALLVPPMAAFAFGINPVVGGLFFAWSLPLAVAVWLATRERERPAAKLGKPLAVGGALAVVVTCLNTYVIASLAKVSVVARALAVMGLRTEARGISTYVYDQTNEPAKSICSGEGMGCAAELASSSLSQGWSEYVERLTRGDLPMVTSSSYSDWYWFFFVAPFLLGTLTLLGDRTSEPHVPTRRMVRVFWGILAGSLVLVPLLLLPLGHLLRVFEPLSGSFALLSNYYQLQTHRILSAPTQGFLVAISWVFAPSFEIRRSFRRCWMLVVAGGLILSLRGFVPAGLGSHRHAAHWRINWPELQAIREIDELVGHDETIVVPAWHMRNGRENLLVADNPEGMIVPHLSSRVLFGVSLGVGRDYSWRDLEARFCESPEKRKALLREVNARWLLVRHKRVRERATYESYRWECGVTMADLGAKFPPAWTKRDLALFRIDP